MKRILPSNKKEDQSKQEWKNPRMKIKSLAEIEEIADKATKDSHEQEEEIDMQMQEQ